MFFPLFAFFFLQASVTKEPGAAVQWAARALTIKEAIVVWLIFGHLCTHLGTSCKGFHSPSSERTVVLTSDSSPWEEGSVGRAEGSMLFRGMNIILQSFYTSQRARIYVLLDGFGACPEPHYWGLLDSCSAMKQPLNAVPMRKDGI